MATINKHYLRIWPAFFEAVMRGKKLYEVRKDDRGFATGDYLVLREFDPVDDCYTGRCASCFIGYISRSAGVVGGYCVFSLLGVREGDRNILHLDDNYASADLELDAACADILNKQSWFSRGKSYLMRRLGLE